MGYSVGCASQKGAHEPWKGPINMSHRYRETPWMHSPSPSQSSYVNGHDSLALGTTLGRLMHGQEQTIVILNRIDERLGQNGEAMVDVLKAMEVKLQSPQQSPSPPPQKPPDRLTGKDWAQIILAAGLIAAALLGKSPVLEKIVPLIVK